MNLKIIFTDARLKTVLVSEFIKNSNIEVEQWEGLKFSEETKINKKVLSESIPDGIGAVPPDGWINFGEHIINIIFTSDISNTLFFGVLGNAIWDTIKKAFKILKKENKGNNDQLAIITDRFSSSIYNKSIYFILYAHQSEEEVNKAVKQIPKVRKRILDLLKVADFDSYGPETIRLTYSGKKWKF